MIKKLYDFRQVNLPDALLQAEVTQEEMAQELHMNAARFTEIVAVEGPVQTGDVVTLEFADAKAEGGMRRIYANVGKGFNDEEELVPGRCLGDRVAVRYAGQDVEAAICAIKRPVVPVMTDALAQQLGFDGVSDLATLDDHIFAKLAEGQRKRKFRGILGLVSKAVMEHTEFAPVQEEDPWFAALFGVKMSRAQKLAEQEGKTVDEVLPMALRMPDKTPEQCLEALKAMCIDRMHQGALGRHYAQENGIVYTEQESIDSYREYGVEPDHHTVIDDMVGKYVDYLNQHMYTYYAPLIQVKRP